MVECKPCLHMHCFPCRLFCIEVKCVKGFPVSPSFRSANPVSHFMNIDQVHQPGKVCPCTTLPVHRHVPECYYIIAQDVYKHGSANTQDLHMQLGTIVCCLTLAAKLMSRNLQGLNRVEEQTGLDTAAGYHLYCMAYNAFWHCLHLLMAAEVTQTA